MKLIELLLDEALEDAGIQAVSLVRFPAIEENFVYFNNHTQYVLAKAEDEQRLLVGPALIPDKKILRVDDLTGEEYEVFFSADTIRRVADKYMRDMRTNEATYEHDFNISDVTAVESWIVEDKKKDKSALYGFKVPVGTWMLSVRVNNEKVWEQVKKKDVRGFSIEGFFVDSLIEASMRRKPCPNCPEDPYKLKELQSIVLEEMNPLFMVEGQPVFASPEEAELYGELFLGCLGSHAMQFDDMMLYMPCESHSEYPTELKDTPCWEGYEMIGFKIKNGKRVPNCVPIQAEKVEMESFSDYPDSVKSNARRGIELNEKEGNKCATQTGKVRAQQLADGEPISEDTIGRMYSYLSRAEDDYDPNSTTKCGTISYLLWGGKAGLNWSRGKLKELDKIE